MAVVVTVAVADVPPKKREPLRAALLVGAVRYGLVTAENVTAIEVEITHEQISCVLAPIEVITQIFGDIVQHIALLCNMLGKIFLAFPLAHISLTEIIKNALIITAGKASITDICLESLFVII